jgi:hypothetical protein
VTCHEKVEKEEEQKLFKAKAVNILGFDTSFDDTEIHVKQEAAQMLREVMRMTYPERAHDQVSERKGDLTAYTERITWPSKLIRSNLSLKIEAEKEQRNMRYFSYPSIGGNLETVDVGVVREAP